MKKVLASLLIISFSTALFAAGTITSKNSSTLSYMAVVGFFVVLMIALVVPISKAKVDKRN